MSSTDGGISPVPYFVLKEISLRSDFQTVQKLSAMSSTTKSLLMDPDILSQLSHRDVHTQIDLVDCLITARQQRDMANREYTDKIKLWKYNFTKQRYYCVQSLFSNIFCDTFSLFCVLCFFIILGYYLDGKLGTMFYGILVLFPVVLHYGIFSLVVIINAKTYTPRNESDKIYSLFLGWRNLCSSVFIAQSVQSVDLSFFLPVIIDLTYVVVWVWYIYHFNFGLVLLPYSIFCVLRIFDVFECKKSFRILFRCFKVVNVPYNIFLSGLVISTMVYIYTGNIFHSNIYIIVVSLFTTLFILSNCLLAIFIHFIRNRLNSTLVTEHCYNVDNLRFTYRAVYLSTVGGITVVLGLITTILSLQINDKKREMSYITAFIPLLAGMSLSYLCGLVTVPCYQKYCCPYLCPDSFGGLKTLFCCSWCAVPYKGNYQKLY
ncbi:hypothetical protein EIN_176330 [Entamoeba invadens IP1]|uniref:hypothetical protein n=1 Tax=Entamoeba invadens IP1 TaxID=370355 RepID=UPI0002C3D069|nr:hypothetical protein EIN_176330 [Entamoeba invadens IP1]ELP93816.1 hypothetical protein EIN_176330 [Entamoeba invadens IP1]|eukprot:XP_004260587.1 hypothetical protein EIN_176330 [Entamoeba invadens IP1]